MRFMELVGMCVELDLFLVKVHEIDGNCPHSLSYDDPLRGKGWAVFDMRPRCRSYYCLNHMGHTTHCLSMMLRVCS